MSASRLRAGRPAVDARDGCAPSLSAFQRSTPCPVTRPQGPVYALAQTCSSSPARQMHVCALAAYLRDARPCPICTCVLSVRAGRARLTNCALTDPNLYRLRYAWSSLNGLFFPRRAERISRIQNAADQTSFPGCQQNCGGPHANDAGAGVQCARLCGARARNPRLTALLPPGRTGDPWCSHALHMVHALRRRAAPPREPL